MARSGQCPRVIVTQRGTARMPVIPAQAGIQHIRRGLDPRFRGGDVREVARDGAPPRALRDALSPKLVSG